MKVYEKREDEIEAQDELKNNQSERNNDQGEDNDKVFTEKEGRMRTTRRKNLRKGVYNTG